MLIKNQVLLAYLQTSVPLLWFRLSIFTAWFYFLSESTPVRAVVSETSQGTTKEVDSNVRLLECTRTCQTSTSYWGNNCYLIFQLLNISHMEHQSQWTLRHLVFSIQHKAGRVKICYYVNLTSAYYYVNKLYILKKNSVFNRVVMISPFTGRKTWGRKAGFI